MRTLYITNTYLQGRSGVVNASKAFINAFAELSESMTLVFPQKPENYIPEINTNNVELIPIEDKRNKILKLCGFILGKMHRFSDETIQLFNKECYDIVVFDSSVTSSCLIKKARNRGLKVITIHHNYEIEYVKGDKNSILKIPLLFWTYIYEKQSVCYSNLNLTLTLNDAMSLKKHYDKDGRYEVLGTFEYKHSNNQVTEAHSRNSMTFVITGQLYSIQTEQSLFPWIKKYYTLLNKQYPDAKVVVAGRNPSEKLIKVCRVNGIEIIPSPNDIDAIVRGGDYYVCPTELGSGLKLRIMDGLQQGLMVLTHERSARGYEKMMERHVLFSYNDSQSFIDALNRMVENKANRNTVYKAYLDYFSYEAGVERLEKILKKYELLKY